ncbi:MAG TPA: septation ring formation regulator EzrA [Bacilli bacterium]|nr:septation ring formation regulator EzrA [Bacilli bacterium]
MIWVYSILAIVLIGIIVGTIFRKKLYKEVDRLEEWKIDIMNRPITEEISKVKGLMMSGQTEKKFEQWRQIWDEILSVELPDIEEDFFDIEEMANKYRFRKGQEYIKETEEKLNRIEAKLAELLEDIRHLVHSEEQNRTEIGDVRELYLEVKKQFSVGRSAFRKAVMWIEADLGTYDEKFANFEAETSEGNYLNASHILEEIKGGLTKISEHMDKLPNMYIQLESGFPNEFRDLKDGMDEMIEGGFSLEHFTFEADIEKLKAECAYLIQALNEQKLDNVEERMNEIDKQIEAMYDALEHEVKAKHEVQEQIELLHKQILFYDEKLQELIEETKIVQQSYRMSEEELSLHEKINKDLLELTKMLQIIDDAIENQSQSYTSILSMVKEVNAGFAEVEKELTETKEKLTTLRKDELKAHETLNGLKSKLIHAKRRLQKSNIPGVPESIIHDMTAGEKRLKEALERLSEVPLEMGIINHLVQDASEYITSVDERVEETIARAHFAELLIQSGNRFRNRSDIINAQLAAAEAAFRNFSYDEAIDMAMQVVEQYDVDAIERLKEEVAVTL